MRLVVQSVGLVMLIAAGPAVAQEPKPKASPTDRVFGLTNVLQLHLELSAKDFAGLEPVGGGFPFGGFGAPKKDPPKVDPKADIHKGGSFGLEFPWVRGTLTVDGKTYKDVGFRYKGGGSYVLGANRLKRNLKIDFDRHNPKQRFHGLKSINLNAGAMDPAGVREALAFAVYRDAGVPTPRTAYAEVTLTVPGKYDRELVGTYTLIEEVDKDFLKRRFQSDKGLLMKPEVDIRRFGRGPLSHQGDDWEPYKAALKPKDEATREQADRMIAFLKLIDRGTDEQFRREVGTYLDLDQFFRFFAATTLLANLDSFFTGGHNAYLYLDAKSNKVVFMPWDLDLAFGTFFLLGTPDHQADLSIMHPYSGEFKLVDRLFAIPDMAERYKKVVRELTTTVFTKEKLAARLTELEKATRDARAREAKASSARKESTGMGFGMPAIQPPDLRAWVDKRLTSVNAQLDGKSTGMIPAGFGQPPGGARGGRLGEVLPAPARDALRLTPEQRTKFDELQKELDGRVDQLLTEEQRATLKRLREAGPKGPPGPPPGKGFGPGGKG